MNNREVALSVVAVVPVVAAAICFVRYLSELCRTLKKLAFVEKRCGGKW
jgi:hypothetical protein